MAKIGNWILTDDMLTYDNPHIAMSIPMTKERLQDLKCLINAYPELKDRKVVGYQLEVNGTYLDFNGMLYSFQIFKSFKQIQEWLNAYGTLCGLDENTFVEVINIYEDDIEDYSFVGEVDKKAIEVCPCCDTEVEIANRFMPQICPTCGETILPCNMCFECKDCPFGGDTCKTKYFKTWSWDCEIKRFILG